MDNSGEESLTPYERTDLIGHNDAEELFRKQIDESELHHGWMLTGPLGVGKATMAARIARAMLVPDALQSSGTLNMAPDTQIVHQIAGLAHPDFFVAKRDWDEKKGRLETEISVAKIRKLSHFLSHTASGSGARVAIIDAADEMNNNAANAVLKILEEPPSNTLILLIANAPGKLLPTIRSRCRAVTLRPVEDVLVNKFVREQTGCSKEEADLAARAACGCPGYALKMITDDGLVALAEAEKFITLAEQGGDFSALATRFGGKSDETRWSIFRTHLLSTLSLRARAIATSGDGVSPQPFLEGWEVLTKLSARGEGLNLDRPSLIEAMGYDLTKIFRKAA